MRLYSSAAGEPMFDCESSIVRSEPCSQVQEAAATLALFVVAIVGLLVAVEGQSIVSEGDSETPWTCETLWVKHGIVRHSVDLGFALVGVGLRGMRRPTWKATDRSEEMDTMCLAATGCRYFAVPLLKSRRAATRAQEWITPNEL